MAKFDAKELSRLDWVVVGTAAVALISLFLPWYGASGGAAGFGYSASVSGWSTGYGWIGAVLIVGAGSYLVMQRSRVDLSKVKLGPAVVVLGASVVGTLLVILRWLSLPRGHGGVQGVATFDYGPRVGIWLTLVVGIVQALCALSLFRSSGEKLPWQAS